MKTYVVQWRPEAHEDMAAFTRYVAQDSSAAHARRLQCRIVRAVNKGLRHAPLAYSPAPEWGEGMRRMPILGRRVLFKVDDAAHIAHVVAVVGGAENPREVR